MSWYLLLFGGQVDGSAVAVYNLGLIDHRVGSMHYKLKVWSTIGSAQCTTSSRSDRPSGRLSAPLAQGLIDHRVGSMHHKLNDNLFHRLRLFRSGANVSLQVDDLPPANKQPTGKSPDIRDESVPKIIRNGTIKVFLKLKSAFWKFQTITVSECCLIKLLPYILFDRYIYILALEMASPGNQHCDNCIGTLSFPV